MKNIVIKRCPFCPSIHSQAEGIAEHLAEDLGVNVVIEDGEKDELNVLMDGVVVVRRTGDGLPTSDEVETAVMSHDPLQQA